MHRIVIEAGDEGWLLRRPGWPVEYVDRLDWAQRAAESLAHEFHDRCGRPACVVVAANDGERTVARFG